MNSNRNMSSSTTASAIVLTLAAAMAPCRAQVPPAPTDVARLERIFWVCDHAAARMPIDVGTAVACVQATDALKLHKFGGKFDLMLAWWREHKDAQYLALDNAAIARTAAARR